MHAINGTKSRQLLKKTKVPYPTDLLAAEGGGKTVHWRGLRKRMKLSRIGRISMALVVSVAMGLGMTACGGGTIGFMWVPGTQYNQIAAFKIDDFTGNLTAIPHSPFSSGGSNPVAITVKQG